MQKTDHSEEQQHSPPEVHDSFFGALEIQSPARILIFLGCLLASLAVAILLKSRTDLTPPAARALFILLFAATLWVTEAIPAYAVGLLVIGLNIALLGDPEGVFAETAKDWEQFVVVLGHPLVWLFFGGFVLAAGMAQTGLDRSLATRLLERLGQRPANILLGVMGITFVLSMFMSNTATTAMMLALLGPLLASMDTRDAFAKALLLGVAVAANVGGMGSLIGTPPNAIAVGALAELPDGHEVTFLQWILVGFPPACFLLISAWVVILRLYPSEKKTLQLSIETEADRAEHAPRWQKLVVSATLLMTVGLWLTSKRHGIPTAAVSFVPIVFFTVTGILGTREIRRLNYDVLFLLAGGLALGQVVASTGLSTWIVERLPVGGLGVVGLTFVICYVTVVLSNFMSNTAAANILVPITITIATGFEARVAIPLALSASAAMCLPIATPPNALAFATGRCETRDFLWLGVMVGLVAPAVAILWTSLVLDWVLGVS